jgi:hypothetical protein
VQHGCQTAEVSVKLRNTADGHNFQLYGSSVTVRRTWALTGSSTLQLLNHDGQVVSRDRKEVSCTSVTATAVTACTAYTLLGSVQRMQAHFDQCCVVLLFCMCCCCLHLEAMLDSFNIQVDNPCVLMDQETSKKFVQSSSEEKHAFFMRATGECRYIYTLILNNA